MTHKLKLMLFPFLVVFYEIAIFISNDMYLPSMPAIANDLLLSDSQIKLTLTFWFLGASSMQFILGPVSDRYGRKRVLVAGAAIFVVSSMVCAMTHDINVMLLARFFQGLALCSLVAANAAIHELYGTKQAIKLLALMGSISILAPALGPLGGALLIQFANWRYIFWLFVVMGLISFFSFILFMPDTDHGAHEFRVKTIFKDYKKILSNKHFMGPNLAYSFLVGIFYFWMFESPFIIIDTYKHSTLYYGFAQTAIFSLFIVGAFVTKYWLKYYSVISLIRFATIISVLGTVIFFLVSVFYPTMTMIVACMMFISFGNSMLFGPINRVAIEACTQPMGRRVAVFSTTISVFGVISGIILALITHGSIIMIATLILICMLISAALIAPISASAFHIDD